MGYKTERPGAVGIDAVFKAVQVEAVAGGRIAIQHVDRQALAGARVEHTSRDALVPRGLIDIRSDQFRCVRLCVVAVEILVVNQRVERGGSDFARLYPPELVAGIEHVVAPHRLEQGSGAKGLYPVTGSIRRKTSRRVRQQVMIMYSITAKGRRQVKSARFRGTAQ